MKALCKALLVAVVLSQIGCGTIMYPERRFQNRTGRIDPGVVGMDAAWMLVFVVPGVVALLVDFVTGAIYLPEGQRHFLEPRAGARLAILEVPRGGTLEVRAPDGVSRNTHWRFELVSATGSAVLVSWNWSGDSSRVIEFPDSLARGVYEMRVIRDATVAATLPVWLHG